MRQRPAGSVDDMSPKLLMAYRVVSVITGIGLIVLVCVAMPIKYVAALGGNPAPTAVIGQIHGFLYMAYLVLTLALAYTSRPRWSLGKALLVALAGTIPFAVFFAEHRVVADARAQTQAPSPVG